jgi:hypothetical protein
VASSGAPTPWCRVETHLGASPFALLALLLTTVACQPPTTTKDAPLTPESKAYVANLKLSEVAMKATESYSGQVITEIEGKITNAGQRTVDRAVVACVFYDSINQLVLRARVPIVSKPLRPGETKSFRLPFDNIPPSWNNQLPRLVIAQIQLS